MRALSLSLGVIVLVSAGYAQAPVVSLVQAGKLAPQGAAHGSLGALFGTHLASAPAQAATVSISVAQVTNAASFSLPPLPNSSIALGSFFAIFGSGLGPAQSSCGTNLTDCIWKPYPLPTEIKGASVKVTVGTTSVDAYIYFAIDSQINAVLPSGTPVGAGQVTVTFNGQTSAPFPINIVNSSFGSFSVNQSGNGPSVITDAGFQLNTVTHTAKPLQAMILWGTGLGPAPDIANENSAGPCPKGCDLRSPNFLVDVYVGVKKATVAYAGRAPLNTGEDQVVFTVPSDSVTGCYVDVAVYSGAPGSQVISNFTTMAVDSAGGTCSDANGINVNDIAGTLQSRGPVNAGVIHLSSNHINVNSGALQVVTDEVSGYFASISQRALVTSQGFAQTASVGACVVTQFKGLDPSSPDPVLGQLIFLDGGAALSINGSKGTQSIPKTSTGVYFATVGGTSPSNPLGANTPPYFLDQAFNFLAGTYTVSGPGGAAVGSFNANVNIPAPITWTNQTTVIKNPIPRSQDLTITWSGGDPSSFVNITGVASTTSNPAGPQPSEPGGTFTCIAPVSAGQFVVPSVVLQALPSTVGSKSVTIPPGYLVVGSSGPATKMNPVPTALDVGYIFYRVVSGANVTWQ